MHQARQRFGVRAWIALAATVIAVAGVLALTTSPARADDPTAVELNGNWFGNIVLADGSVRVELQIRAVGLRRFEWLALEDFGGGFMDVAIGDGTIADMGQGEINGDGLPDNPAGLLRIEAHGMVEGPPGSMTADFMYRGKNVDGSSIIGVLRLEQRRD
jgi:hypothetical protein